MNEWTAAGRVRCVQHHSALEGGREHKCRHRAPIVLQNISWNRSLTHFLSCRLFLVSSVLGSEALRLILNMYVLVDLLRAAAAVLRGRRRSWPGEQQRDDNGSAPGQLHSPHPLLSGCSTFWLQVALQEVVGCIFYALNMIHLHKLHTVHTVLQRKLHTIWSLSSQVALWVMLAPDFGKGRLCETKKLMSLILLYWLWSCSKMSPTPTFPTVQQSHWVSGHRWLLSLISRSGSRLHPEAENELIKASLRHK